MADLLDRVLREIRERKERSRAAVEESRRLEAALAALQGERGGPGRGPRPRRGGRGGGGPRRRARRGANRDAIVGVVSERPGVSAAELAGATGIARATVASTLSRLVAAGVLERVALPAGGRGYRLAGPAAESGGDGEDHQEPASAPAGSSEG
jgi:predicted HTH transcriptional regulator